MSEPAVPLVLSRITIATIKFNSRVKLTCLTTDRNDFIFQVTSPPSSDSTLILVLFIYFLVLRERKLLFTFFGPKFR